MRVRHKDSGFGIAMALGLTGCQRAPSVDVLGSFFPVWIFCIAGGILLTLAARLALMRAKLDTEMRPVAIVYPSMAALFSFVLWLVFFRD